MNTSEELRVDISEGAIELLNGFIWHDSVLHEVRLVRTNSVDQVVLHLELLEDWEKQISRNTEIIFEECKAIQVQMSGNIICMSAGEMIGDAEASTDGHMINDFMKKWQHFYVNESNTPQLGQFALTLASTGSLIEIVFSSVIIRYKSKGGTHSAPPPYYPKPSS